MFSPFPALDITSTKLITFFKVCVQHPCFQFVRRKENDNLREIAAEVLKILEKSENKVFSSRYSIINE